MSTRRGAPHTHSTVIRKNVAASVHGATDDTAPAAKARLAGVSAAERQCPRRRGDRGLGHGRRREDEGQHDEAARRQSRPVATRRPVSCAKASKRLAARRVCGRATGMVAGLGHLGTQV